MIADCLMLSVLISALTFLPSGGSTTRQTSKLALNDSSAADVTGRRDSLEGPLLQQQLPLAAMRGLSAADASLVIPGMVRTVLQGRAGQSATVVQISMGLLRLLSSVITPDEPDEPNWISTIPEGRIVCRTATLPDEDADAGLPESILDSLLMRTGRLSENERTELLSDNKRRTQFLAALNPEQLIEQRWSHEEVLDLGDGKRQLVSVTYVLVRATDKAIQPIQVMLDSAMQSDRVRQIGGSLTILLLLQCLGFICLRRIS